MKALTTEFLARMRRGVTTLCTCIAIRRRDGISVYFTDHDMPVEVGGVFYEPFHSFSRTSVASTCEMDVDGLELTGILNTEAVDRDDVASGAYDFAEVEVFVADYEMPEAGKCPLRVGWIGEIAMNEDGTFEAEVRGLSQVYTYRIGESYTPECRASLGDRRCKVPVGFNRATQPWQPSKAYRKGDTILAVINAATNFETVGLVNASFEDDDLNVNVRNPTGWFTYGSETGRWEPRIELDGLNGAPGGTMFIAHRNQGGDSIDLGMFQTIDLADQGIDLDGINTGLSRLTASVWMGCTSNVSKGRFRVYAQIPGVAEALIYDSGAKQYAEDRWTQENGCKDVIIPAGTTKLKFDLYATKYGHHATGMAFDKMEAVINYPDGTYGSQDQYGEVAFIARNAGTSGATQPAFTNVPGQSFVDNTITWDAVKAFTKVASVEAPAVTNKSFVATGVTEVEGYYDGGVLTWETGMNAGRSQEVKSWKGGRITFFQRPYYAMIHGDRFTVYPGCDKRRSTCAEKFANILNFRGEPDVPGQDEYYKTPNSSSAE
jgi:uncharacterized phage protein (TIGR02218 family)